MVSTSGPIPPQPYYDKGNKHNYVDMPVPRVRPEGRDIASHGQHGTVGLLFQVEGRRIGGPRRQKPEPRDHISENVRRMRKIQRDVRKKEALKSPPQAQQPVKALWKSCKYEGVQSRVAEALLIQREPDAPRPHSARPDFLRAHSRTGWCPTPRASRPSSADGECSEVSVPKAMSAREVKLVRHDIDFIKLNGRSVKHVNTMKRSPSMTALDDLKKKHEDDEANYHRGQVPKYLQRRKDDWQREEEERIANEPDPDMPEGHRLMPEDERRATLEKLKLSERELVSQLSSMPVRTDTLHLRTRKEGVEKKMTEIEEAMRIFSRKKVFVRLDS